MLPQNDQYVPECNFSAAGTVFHGYKADILKSSFSKVKLWMKYLSQRFQFLQYRLAVDYDPVLCFVCYIDHSFHFPSSIMILYFVLFVILIIVSTFQVVKL